VDVFDFGVEHGLPFLVMELVEGETLADQIVREGPLPLARLVELLLPVVSAVAELHAAGILHRDLKPANILLARARTGKPTPKVADLGISRFVDDSSGITRSGVVLGTYANMAPEQLAGNTVSERSDQYALGTILYECATGSLPFEGANSYELSHAIMTAPIVPPSVRNTILPKSFDAVVLRAMSRAPDARFSCVEELGEALLAFAAPEIAARWASEFRAPTSHADSMSLAAVAASPSAGPPGSRARARIARATILSAVLVGVVGVGWTSRHLERRKSPKETPATANPIVPSPDVPEEIHSVPEGPFSSETRDLPSVPSAPSARLEAMHRQRLGPPPLPSKAARRNNLRLESKPGGGDAPVDNGAPILDPE
jgi:serine/threonine-protein kinase